MESQDTIFEKLKQSKVFKVLSGYAIAAFVTVQVASLVSDSFGLEEEFMQNIIIVFLVILPFIALVAWAASSKYGTFKILGISLFLLFTGYGTGSYIWVNSYMLPQAKDYLSEDDNVSAWLTSSKINSSTFLILYNLAACTTSPTVLQLSNFFPFPSLALAS